MIALLALAGCATVSREPAPSTPGGIVSPAGLPPDVRRPELDTSSLEPRSREFIARLRRLATDGSLDILALSGGGAGGAFGAGALAGWSARGDRPQFEVVTGVSAGALIAPFAFLGPQWDRRLEEALTGPDAANVLHIRTLDVLFRPSIYRGKPLADFVDRTFTDDLIDAVARASADGRVLLVATTDLDRQATVIWNLGVIARQGTPASRALFRKVLVASSSIPGVFPPVLIGGEDQGRPFDEMHVDGGATAAFFFAPEVALIVPGALNDLAGANLYVLMNTQLTASPETTRVRIDAVVARAFMSVLTQMSRTQLQLASAFAHERAMKLRESEIPVDYPYGGSIDFRSAAIRSLFDYAKRCAERGEVWMTLPESLARSKEGVARMTANPAQRRSPEDVPCPAAFNRAAVPAADDGRGNHD